MKKALYLIAIPLFLLSCNTDRNNNRSENNDQDTHMDGTMDGTRDAEFHKKHIADLHNAMDVMMKDFRQNEFSGDADYDFALIMKRHHQGAMDMTKCVIDNGTDAELKALATKINERQLHDIQEFDLIIQDKTNAKGDSDFATRALVMTTPMNEMKHGTTLDNTYASIMINHHRDAVEISEEFLKGSRKHPKMAQIATEIINNNPDEIREFEAYRSK